jgi:hypothetical protein
LAATSKDGIRLPEQLTGTLVTRSIVIDGALLYLVTGALSEALSWQFEQTGTLTTEEAKDALMACFLEYLGVVP